VNVTTQRSCVVTGRLPWPGGVSSIVLLFVYRIRKRLRVPNSFASGNVALPVSSPRRPRPSIARRIPS
jgi:hypothetical protein